MAKLGGNPTAGGGTTDVNIISSVPLSVVEPVSVDDNGGSLTVDGVFFPATQPVSGTVTVNAGVGPWPVTDNGGSLTVDGTFFQATQPVSGTVTANAGTGPFPVSDNGGSLTVDGAFFQATQPVSGTVTANAGTGPFPVSDNGGSLTVDGAFFQATQPVSGAFFQATQPVSIAGNQAINLVQVAGAAVVASAAGVQKTGIASGATGNSFVEATATNMAATVSATGGQISPLPGNWSVVSFPAVTTKASASKAAGAAGVRHVCTGASFSFQQPAAVVALASNLQIRDGATGAGTIIWQQTFNSTVASTTVSVNLTGLNIIGTAATAMTAEFAVAGGLNTQEAVVLTGYSTSG